MPFYFPLFLAWRFITTASNERSISIMIRLCFWGILISTFALALISAVMKGFESVTNQKLQGIHSDLLIRSYNPGLNYPAVKDFIRKEFSDSIEAISPNSIHHLLITKANNKTTTPTIAVAYAINPATFAQVSSLPKTIIAPGKQPFENFFSNNNILIGKELALQENLHVGDHVTLFIPSDNQSKNITLQQTKAQIGGIFSTGIDEFDANGIFASEDFMYKTIGCDNTITHIIVKLRSEVNATAVKEKLARRLAPITVVSWQDLYAALVSALVLEKYAMIIILSLIVLVASMNTISLLFMYLSSKKRTLAVLFSMGLSQKHATITFVALGFLISCSATLIGLSLAVIASFLLDHYQLITLPNVYYTLYLPAHMDGSIVLTTLLLTLMLSILATWYPTRQIKRINISHILKFEM